MRLLISIATSVLLASCDSLTGPHERLVLGTVAYYSEPVVIEVPDTVAVSVAFSVRVRTYGGGCERIGPTEVEVDGRNAEITPFDYTVSGDGVHCIDILQHFDHEASLTFGTIGSVTVTIRGKEEPGDLPFKRIHRVWVR